MDNSVCLLSTLHDPDGKLLEPIRDHFRDIVQLYEWSIVDVTDETHNCLLPFLGHYYTFPKGKLGLARRRVLEAGLEQTDCKWFHFVDFDRLLFWYIHYSHQLNYAIGYLQTEQFTVFSRTPSALASHPYLQRTTEELASHIAYSDVKTWYAAPDLLAASRGIPRDYAELIVSNSVGKEPAYTDIEWPRIVGWENVDYCDTDGLSYESDIFGIQKSVKDEVQLRIKNLQDAARAVYGD